MTTALLALALAPQSTPLNTASMDGWVIRGGKAAYRFENGEIIGTTAPNSPNTFLCTEKMYGNFDLELEIKVDPRMNSGIQFRSNSVPGYNKGVVHGYQAEVDPSERAWSGGLYDESRRGWLKDLKDNPTAQKAWRQNEWNKYRIRAVNDHIEIWVNGVKTTDFRDDVTQWGFIGLQVHGVGAEAKPMEVRWRNLRINDMGMPSKNPPRGSNRLLFGPNDLKNWGRNGDSSKEIGWVWKDGALEGVPGTGDIQAKHAHSDALIYLEFMVDENNQQGQANGNSGFYLQGRYEVQILNSAGQAPAHDLCGGLYGVKAPDYNMAYPPYQWQSYLAKFTAPKWENGQKKANARVTVWHNGTMIHRDVELPGTTTSGNAEEEQPMGIKLQDHGHPIRFRNIWMKSL